MIARDKILHLFISGLLSFAFMIACNVIGLNVFIGPALALLIGIGKEVIYDGLLCLGNPEWGDLWYDVLGVGSGGLVFFTTTYWFT